MICDVEIDFVLYLKIFLCIVMYKELGVKKL